MTSVGVGVANPSIGIVIPSIGVGIVVPDAGVVVVIPGAGIGIGIVVVVPSAGIGIGVVVVVPGAGIGIGVIVPSAGIVLVVVLSILAVTGRRLLNLDSVVAALGRKGGQHTCSCQTSMLVGGNQYPTGLEH